MLLVTNRLDRIQSCGLDGRVNAKQQPNEYGHTEGDRDGGTGNHGGPSGGRRDDTGQREAEADADQPADDGDQDRLGQELPHDISLAGADGAADADLARTFQYCGEHDVHDPDAAYQQRNAGDADHDDVEDELGAAALFQQSGGHHHGEVAGVLVGGGEDGAHHVGGLDGVHPGGHFHVNAVDLVLQVTGI